jgi:hypothetical protein
MQNLIKEALIRNKGINRHILLKPYLDEKDKIFVNLLELNKIFVFFNGRAEFTNITFKYNPTTELEVKQETVYSYPATNFENL